MQGIRHPYSGLYIVFEGIGCSGKSTQTKILYNYLYNYFPTDKLVLVREPGETEIGILIRKTLLGENASPIFPMTEVYLFGADRAETLQRVVIPVLENGGVVIADRSIYSSLVYQGFARELGWRRVWRANQEAVGQVLPDLVVFPEISVETSLERLVKREEGYDRFDAEEARFFQRVKEGYNFLIQQEPSRFLVVDGQFGIEAQTEIILGRIWEVIREKGIITLELDRSRGRLRGKERG